MTDNERDPFPPEACFLYVEGHGWWCDENSNPICFEHPGKAASEMIHEGIDAAKWDIVYIEDVSPSPASPPAVGSE